MSDKIIYTTDAKFEADVLKSEQPVLVDFWAEWCSPCRAIAPLLDDIANEDQGKMKVAKVDITNNQQTPAKLGIRSIPTLMVFKDGKLVATKVGALSKTQLKEFIDGQL